MKLVQVRECDGKCCEESPRWPNINHTDCIYHKNGSGKETSGCMLMTGEEDMPTESSPAQPDKNAEETFKKTCVDWPQNIPERGTAGCCWQWIDGN